jgi:hypothetical protein
VTVDQTARSRLRLVSASQQYVGQRTQVRQLTHLMLASPEQTENPTRHHDRLSIILRRATFGMTKMIGSPPLSQSAITSYGAV